MLAAEILKRLLDNKPKQPFQMIPLFQNPHLLAQSITKTTRAQIYGSNGSEKKACNDPRDAALLQQLNELVHGFIGDIPASHSEVRREIAVKGTDTISQGAIRRYMYIIYCLAASQHL
jgi:hypothetical protein